MPDLEYKSLKNIQKSADSRVSSSTPLSQTNSHIAPHTNIIDEGFEMEMGVHSGGIFSPVPSSVTNGNPAISLRIDDSIDIDLFRDIVRELHSRADVLKVAVENMSKHKEQMKYDFIEEDDELSGDEADTGGKKSIASKVNKIIPTPPRIDRIAFSMQLRYLADVIEGNKTMSGYSAILTAEPSNLAVQSNIANIELDVL